VVKLNIGFVHSFSNLGIQSFIFLMFLNGLGERRPEILNRVVSSSYFLLRRLTPSLISLGYLEMSFLKFLLYH